MSVLGFDLDRLLDEHALNAGLAWVGTAALVAIALVQVAEGDPAGAVLTGAVGLLVAAPGPFYRSLAVTVPWEVVAAGVAASAWNAALPGAAAFYATVAVAALVAVLDLHLFTSARASHRVAAGLVVVATAAVAGAWVAVRWVAATGLGGSPIPNQTALMGELIVASVAGVLGGLGFEVYVVGWEARLDRLTPLLEAGS